MIKLIINADDFGMSDKFDEAIISLMRKKYISSISVLVKNLDRESIKKILKFKKSISIGLHFEYNKNINKKDSYENIKKELNSQYNIFIKLFGFSPSHIDKHNREKSIEEAKVMCDFGIEKNIPIRLYRRGKFFHIYENEYKYKTRIKITDGLYNLGSKNYGIEKIKEDIQKGQQGIYEVICHPGFFDEKYNAELYGTTLNKEREKEYKKVIELNKFLKENNIKIVSFHIFQQFDKKS